MIALTRSFQGDIVTLRLDLCKNAGFPSVVLRFWCGMCDFEVESFEQWDQIWDS